MLAQKTLLFHSHKILNGMARKIFDLSMFIDEKTPPYPGMPMHWIEQNATIPKEGWNAKTLHISSHFSTHIDAPFHLMENGKKLSDFSIEHFVGEAIVIDARNQNPYHPDLNQVKKGDIVFFYTGHTEKMGSTEFEKIENNPMISPETVRELIQKKARIIGMDAFTPDAPPFSLHKGLFKHDIMIVENLVNLKPLNGKRFECFVLPLNIRGGDGAPCRVIGIVRD